MRIILMWKFHGWSRPRNYFSSKIFPIYGIHLWPCKLCHTNAICDAHVMLVWCSCNARVMLMWCSCDAHVMFTTRCDEHYLVKMTIVLSRRPRSCSFCTIKPTLASISWAASPNSPRSDWGREQGREGGRKGRREGEENQDVMARI